MKQIFLFVCLKLLPVGILAWGLVFYHHYNTNTVGRAKTGELFKVESSPWNLLHCPVTSIAVAFTQNIHRLAKKSFWMTLQIIYDNVQYICHHFLILGYSNQETARLVPKHTSLNSNVFGLRSSGDETVAIGVSRRIPSKLVDSSVSFSSCVFSLSLWLVSLSACVLSLSFYPNCWFLQLNYLIVIML